MKVKNIKKFLAFLCTILFLGVFVGANPIAASGSATVYIQEKLTDKDIQDGVKYLITPDNPTKEFSATEPTNYAIVTIGPFIKGRDHAITYVHSLKGTVPSIEKEGKSSLLLAYQAEKNSWTITFAPTTDLYIEKGPTTVKDTDITVTTKNGKPLTDLTTKPKETDLNVTFKLAGSSTTYTLTPGIDYTTTISDPKDGKGTIKVTVFGGITKEIEYTANIPEPLNPDPEKQPKEENSSSSNSNAKNPKTGSFTEGLAGLIGISSASTYVYVLSKLNKLKKKRNKTRQ